MRLVCFGDSNTYGYDPCSPLGARYPAQIRWTGRLKALAGLEVVNLGRNGRAIPLQPEVRTAAAAELSAAGPADLTAVMLGSNDLLLDPALTAGTVAERMARFLPAVTGPVLLIAPPPLTSGTWVSDSRSQAQSTRLAWYYERTARQLGAAFADSGAWGVELSFDGVHFTEAGHAAFADGLLSILRPHL